MFGLATAYVVAIFAMVFSGASALTLIYTVSHLDSSAPSPAEDVREPDRAA
jgi:hypothetical protein